jgi:hypothetical protein
MGLCFLPAAGVEVISSFDYLNFIFAAGGRAL